MKDKILAYGTFGLVFYHFVCCGLPSLAAIAGGSTLLSVKKILTHAQMGCLLVISGILLVTSLYMATCGQTKCNCEKKKLSFCKIVLYTSVLMYVTAVYFHLFPAGMPMNRMAH